jgi:hypothetical protein
VPFRINSHGRQVSERNGENSEKIKLSTRQLRCFRNEAAFCHLRKPRSELVERSILVVFVFTSPEEMFDWRKSGRHFVFFVHERTNHYEPNSRPEQGARGRRPQTRIAANPAMGHGIMIHGRRAFSPSRRRGHWRRERGRDGKDVTCDTFGRWILQSTTG